jgi:hypothetical protein
METFIFKNLNDAEAKEKCEVKQVRGFGKLGWWFYRCQYSLGKMENVRNSAKN